MSAAASPSASDRCPRCGGSFHCGMADAAPCACTGFHLSADLQRRLRERYAGCLCPSCLEALSRGAAIEGADIEGIESL